MAGVVAVINPERRIELNAFDIDAWNLLLRESQVRSHKWNFCIRFVEYLINSIH